MVAARDYFSNSDCLDYFSTRMLSHINPNWELTWDYKNNRYREEEYSFANLLNKLIDELEDIRDVNIEYHDFEDKLCNNVVKNLKWVIRKKNKHWQEKRGAEWLRPVYESILEQGGFSDEDQSNLIYALADRIQAAFKYRQKNFDETEIYHRKIIGAIVAIIIYHKIN